MLFALIGGLPPAPIAEAACVDAPASVSAWWPLDTDAGSGTFSDLIGGPNAVSPTGVLTLVPGVVGTAVSLDGVSQYLSVPHTAAGPTIAAMTLMAWIRLDAASNEPIIAKGPAFNFAVIDGEFELAFCDDHLCYTTGITGSPLFSTQWIHVAVTMGVVGGSATARFYVNGNEIKTSTWTSVGSVPFTDPLTIGYSSVSQAHLDGAIDEVALFDQVLSQPEIQAIWAAQADGMCRNDCNGNGILDAVDFANGTVADCNANGVPDVCDVDPADPDGDGIVLDDCNGNGVPDVCEPDCNGNGIVDACDVDPADPDGDGIVYADCNRNGVPDPCEGITGPIYVDDDPGPVSGAIGSETNPYRRIRDAINATQSGCEIIVRAGLYNESGLFINWSKRGLRIVGEAGADATVLHVPSSFGLYVLQTALELEGLTIDGGHSNSEFDHLGGGIYSRNASLIMRGCVLKNGVAETGGGNLASFYGDLTMEDCRIESGIAPQGGGVWVVGQNGGVFRRCVFSGNVGGLYASGSGLSEGSILLEDCVFEQNVNPNGPGGAEISLAQTIALRRCRFFKNYGATAGGLYVWSTSSISDCAFAANVGVNGGALEAWGATIVNTSVGANQASGSGGGVYLEGASSMRNSIVWGNTPDNAAGSAAGNLVWSIVEGVGSSQDPMFANPAAGDLRLRPDSPAIDAGRNLYTTATLDLLGNPRRADDPLVPDTGEGTAPIVDLGAYEGAAGVPGGALGVAPGGNVSIHPEGDGDPRHELVVDFTNDTQQDADVWVAAVANLHAGEGAFVLLPAQAIVETSAPDGGHLTRVSLPFQAADLAGTPPQALDLVTYDASSATWSLAVAANALPSPGHAGPVGDRFFDIGWPAPALSADRGDYGVVWDPGAGSGFAWANVDHTTDFAIGFDAGTVDVGDPGADGAVPVTTRLLSPSPNPTRGGTTIRFDIAREEETELAVFDVAGRRVRVLARGRMRAGAHHLVWSGADDAGRPVRTGIYFVKLKVGAFEDTRRMVVLR